MLEDIRTSLKRKGDLKSAMNLATTIAKSVQENSMDHMNQNEAKQSHNILGASQKTFLERTLDKILTSIEVELNDSAVNFYLYSDAEKKIEEGNIKKFYSSFLLKPEFRN